MRIVFVICEGPHDVAFLSRILSSVGYVNYKERLNNFPYPLNDWLVQMTKNLSVEEFKVNRVFDELNMVLPRGAMVNEDRGQMILLYSLNGDQRKKERKRIIDKVSDWTRLPEDNKAFSVSEQIADNGNTFGLIVFNDADDLGIDARLKEIKDEMKDDFPFVDSIVCNGSIACDDGKVKVSAYVFAEDGKEFGTLENILLPLMKQGEEQIFEDANCFLKKHKDESRLKSLVFCKNDSGMIVEDRVKTNKYYHTKSLIGVVGQLQFSGSSNVVCIEKADYINLDKIAESRTCQDILRIFEGF